MPSKIQRKCGKSIKTLQTFDGELTAKNNTAVTNPPAQSSFASEEPKVDSGKAKRVRKKTNPFQITAPKRASKNKSNKKVIVNTFEGVGDVVQLLNTFPEEIWMIILNECTEPSALENLSNASLYFRDRLFQQRAVFLFPSVWNILASKNHKNFEKFGNSTGNDESFNLNKHPLRWILNTENIFREYPILKLRLVCKMWNQSIEHFYQYHPSHFNTKEQSKCIVSRTTKWPELDERSVRKFLLHFQNTHGPTNDYVNGEITRNPFLNRKVSLELSVDDREKNLVRWQHMSTFLTSYGHHIWHLDLEITNFSYCDSDSLCMLQYVFYQMPNLKGLRVLSPCYHEESPLSRETLNARLPKLKNLQFLSICEMPYFVQHKLERANSHVSKLEFEHFNQDNSQEECETFSCPHPNLSALAVTLNEYDDHKRLKLFNMKWKISELTLSFSDDVDVALATFA